MQYIELLWVTTAPVVLLVFGLIETKYRLFAFLFFFLFAYHSISYHKLTKKQLGIRIDNFKNSIREFVFFSIFATIILVSIDRLQLSTYFISKTDSFLNIPLYLFLSIPLQQFIYFSYAKAVLDKYIKNRLLISLVIGILFGILHFPWNNNNLVFLTMSLGIIWGFIYTRNPNFWISTITHMFLGFLVIVLIS